MNIFALEIWDDEGSKCIFYIVRWQDSQVNETDKFFNKYYSIEKYKKPIQELLSFITDSAADNRLLYYNGQKEIYL